MKVKVIGAGGIGSALLATLPRFMRYRLPEVELWIIDGDRYEERNAERQVFDEEGNKAEVTARRIARDFPALVVRAVPEYVTDDSAVRLIREGDVVLAGVDNHKTRKILSDRVAELSSALVISGGNELTTGGIQVYWRESGEDATLPLTNQYHPEIAHPKDLLPTEHCTEQAVVAPQLLPMNSMVAAVMMNAFYAWLKKKLDYDEVYIDIVTNMVRSVNRREKTAAVLVA